MRTGPVVIGLAAIASSCGGSAGAPPPASPSSAASATPELARPSPTAEPTPALPPGAVRFAIVGDRSLATIRVREQLAQVTLPGEAVLTTRALSGEAVLLPDGTFAPASKVIVVLDSLKSDSDLRDEWIKINTLQTRRYPQAEFRPTRVSGLPLPLPATGEWDAKLTGLMKIKTTEREVTWDMKVRRSPEDLSTTGRISFRFGDFGMDVPSNRLVLSVVDDVRLEVELVAVPR